jgi:hypothetical protein
VTTWCGKYSVSILVGHLQPHVIFTEQIGFRLGIEIEPRDVRLVPYHIDPYCWRYDHTLASLFEKPLSQHDVSTRQRLLEELGRKYEATSAPREIQLPQSEMVSSTSEESPRELLLKERVFSSNNKDPRDQFLPLLDDDDQEVSLRLQVQNLGSQLRTLNCEQHRQGKVLDSQRKQLSMIASLVYEP